LQFASKLQRSSATLTKLCAEFGYGSSVAGWTANKTFTTPPAAGGSSLRVVMYGDMGKAERDNSDEHYVQVHQRIKISTKPLTDNKKL
jgi:hypothetical protein